MTYAKVTNPINMSGVSPAWYRMMAMGRHASSTTKIVFVGIETFGEDLSVGILNRETNLIETVHSEVIPSAVQSVSAIDCDTATGTYVFQSDSSESGFYYCYWSTNLTSWTQCTESGWNSNAHSGRYLNFDPGNGMWWRSDEVGSYTSDDGKTFYQQKQNYGDLGEQNMVRYWANILKGRFTGDEDASFFPGDTERATRVKTTDTTAPIAFGDVLALFNIGIPWDVTDGIIDYQNPSWSAGGDVNFDGDIIVMAVNSGIMIYSDSDGAPGSWQVAAADQAGASKNEWIDAGAPTLIGRGGLCFCEEEWWAPDGTGGSGNWYRYNGSGAPIGYGWTQDNTGPFGVRTLSNSVRNDYMRDPHSCRFAYMAYDDVNEDVNTQRIIYDTGDL
jgi:hypothetical protein